MRQWLLWVVWLLSLAACPTGLLVVSLSYPDVPTHPPPWPQDSPPARWAQNLETAHACVSLGAAACVFLLVRRWPFRVAAWAGILLWLGATALFTLGVIMAKTGAYL